MQHKEVLRTAHLTNAIEHNEWFQRFKDVCFPPNIMVENGRTSQKAIPLVRFMVILHGAMIEGRITTNNPLTKHSSKLHCPSGSKIPFFTWHCSFFLPWNSTERYHDWENACGVSQVCKYIFAYPQNTFWFAHETFKWAYVNYYYIFYFLIHSILPF